MKKTGSTLPDKEKLEAKNISNLEKSHLILLFNKKKTWYFFSEYSTLFEFFLNFMLKNKGCICLRVNYVHFVGKMMNCSSQNQDIFQVNIENS